MELAIAIAANLVLGLVLLGLFAWRGRRDGTVLAGPAQALDLFRGHFPDATGTVTVAADGRSALICLDGEATVGLVQRHGRRWNVRALEARDLRSVALVHGDTLSLALADFAWPRAQVRFADAQARQRWQARLGELVAQRAARRLVPHA